MRGDGGWGGGKYKATRKAGPHEIGTDTRTQTIDINTSFNSHKTLKSERSGDGGKTNWFPEAGKSFRFVSCVRARGGGEIAVASFWDSTGFYKGSKALFTWPPRTKRNKMKSSEAK